MDWEPITHGKSVPFSAGYAINTIMKEQGGRPLTMAISNELAPLGLYGVELEYKNATVRSYWVDEGTGVVCVAVEPKYK